MCRTPFGNKIKAGMEYRSNEELHESKEILTAYSLLLCFNFTAHIFLNVIKQHGAVQVIVHQTLFDSLHKLY